MGESCRALLRDDAIAERPQLLCAGQAGGVRYVPFVQPHKPLDKAGGEAGSFLAGFGRVGGGTPDDAFPAVDCGAVLAPRVEPCDIA